MSSLLQAVGIALIVGSGIYVLRREANKVELKPIAYAGLTRR